MYSLIPEAWNIQACKWLTGTVAYTWQCRWCWGIFSTFQNILQCFIMFTWPASLLNESMCNLEGLLKRKWLTNPLFTECTRNCVCLKYRGDWWDSGQIQIFAAQWLLGQFAVPICQDVRLILKWKMHTGDHGPVWTEYPFLADLLLC